MNEKFKYTYSNTGLKWNLDITETCLEQKTVTVPRMWNVCSKILKCVSAVQGRA
jgi:hypothetical protein